MRQHQLAPHRVDVPPTHMFTRPAAVQLHNLMQLRAYVPVVIGKVVLESSTRASLCTSCNPMDPCASPGPTALPKVSTRATLRRSCSSMNSAQAAAQRSCVQAASSQGYAQAAARQPCLSPAHAPSHPGAAGTWNSAQAAAPHTRGKLRRRGGTPVVWGSGLHAGALSGRSHGLDALEMDICCTLSGSADQIPNHIDLSCPLETDGHLLNLSVLWQPVAKF